MKIIIDVDCDETRCLGCSLKGGSQSYGSCGRNGGQLFPGKDGHFLRQKSCLDGTAVYNALARKAGRMDEESKLRQRAENKVKALEKKLRAATSSGGE